MSAWIARLNVTSPSVDMNPLKIGPTFIGRDNRGF
jgi:hypothetical protein